MARGTVAQGRGRTHSRTRPVDTLPASAQGARAIGHQPVAVGQPARAPNEVPRAHAPRRRSSSALSRLRNLAPMTGASVLFGALSAAPPGRCDQSLRWATAARGCTCYRIRAVLHRRNLMLTGREPSIHTSPSAQPSMPGISTRGVPTSGAPESPSWPVRPSRPLL